MKGNPIPNAEIIVDLEGEKTLTTNKTGRANISTNGLDARTYAVKISFKGNENYNSSSTTTTITVVKQNTTITATPLTATYRENEYLTITLSDGAGKPLANANVTIDLNGAKTLPTNSDGQINVPTADLAPGTYNVTITFEGDKNHLKSASSVEVAVKKATPKLTAKVKTFKVKTKTKKYSVALKTDDGNAMGKVKVTLKIKGEKYKATTNSKGKATFKITKLNKKGIFKGSVKYSGSKYYNKVTKTVKIKIK